MTHTKAFLKIKAGLCALTLFFALFFGAGGLAEASSIPLLSAQMTSPSKGVFLVADPKIVDPTFKKTIVLLLQYGEEGTVGLIINRPTSVPLSKILPEVDVQRQPVGTLYDGGPVDRKTLTLLYRSRLSPSGAHPIFADVYASQAARVLAEQLRISGAKQGFRLYAGYAGWGAGQLRREMKRGDWHLVKANAVSLYERPAKRIWQEMFNRSQELRVRLEFFESPESNAQPT